MNFRNREMMMSKFGAKSGDFAQRGGLNLVTVIRNAKIERDIKTIFDFENLLSAWGLYQETDAFKDLEKNPVEGFLEFKNDMDKIKIRFNEK